MLFLLIGLFCRDSLGSDWRPLALDEIEMLLSNSVTSRRVSDLVREHGVDFRISEEVENRLRGQGLDNSALAALRESFKGEGPRGGIIRVFSDPDGADVFLRDEPKGVTPLRLAGIHTGRFMLRVGGMRGYGEETVEGEIGEGEIKDVNVVLKQGDFLRKEERSFAEEPIFPVEKTEIAPVGKWRRAPTMKGILYIETEPAGGQIYERGQFKGKAPVEMQLGEGLHVLVFIMRNYEVEAIPIVVRNGINRPLTVKFIPR
ncbi:MAG: PEGA domain-containing protein [Deltaproteobacteria bacterium]|nr:PEGA domain-containing protein [Deltaproteobacteria bacterium]